MFTELLKACKEAGSAHGGGSSLRALHLFAAALKHWRLLLAFERRRSASPLSSKLRERSAKLGILVEPYVHSGWTVPQKFEALSSHYAELETMPWLHVGLTDETQIADLDEVHGGLRIVLDSAPWFAREGELVINLFVADLRVYSLAFTLCRRASQRVAVVGCIQGREPDVVGSLYHDLTKALHGTRPRDLLICAFQMLCEQSGVHSIYGISDANRHHRHPYFRGYLDHRPSANYDEIWIDRGGTANRDGFFVLPARVIPRHLNEVPTHKRAQYRRRYELYEHLRSNIRSWVSGSDSRLSGE